VNSPEVVILVCVASDTVERPAARRWAWNLLQVMAVVVLLFVSACIASLVAPVIVPEGGTDPRGIVLTTSGVEAVQRARRQQWWLSLFINLGLCVLVFHVVPLAWRRWRRRQPQA